MAEQELTRQAVMDAVEEFRTRGRENFLKHYGFGKSNRHFLVIDGENFDSKAIVGAAHQFVRGRASKRTEVRSGQRETVPELQSLGFEVWDTRTGKVIPTSGSVRDPSWTWDQHTLALDLYFRLSDRSFGKSDPEIIRLSDFLRDHFGGSARTERFRNGNGVYMKLMNFRRFDPIHQERGRTGLPAGNKDEQAVWNRYFDDRQALATAVAIIRQATDGQAEPNSQIEEDEGSAEGSIIIRMHKARERDRKLIADKKAAVLTEKGELRCEVCDLRFDERFSGHGTRFIEVHHLKPIGLSEPDRKTKLSELACVCSNCHRMLHFGGLRELDWLRQQLSPPSFE